MKELAILYRGPLESCNYGCSYCPFRKKKESRAELARDEAALLRFVRWAAAYEEPLSIFFTPWGEALIRGWYRRAIARLSHLSHVRRVAIQTNLSTDLGWLRTCSTDKVALWCTYHPEWTTRAKFVAKVAELRDRGVQHSVGVVGFRRFMPEIEALRAELSADVYLWINAVKSHDGGEPYEGSDVAAMRAIDPLFSYNAVPHASLGRACLTGETVVSVDGDGIVRRCHFVKEPLGSLYQGDFRTKLRPRPCPNRTCGCHIGYVHMPDIGLSDVFGAGILERVPAQPVRHLAVVR